MTNSVLLTQSGYLARFWHHVQNSQQYRDPMRRAYLAVEEDLKKEFNCRRYKNYHSFRTGKHKHPKRIKFKTQPCHPHF